MGVNRNDPRARQLLEKLLKKSIGASGSGLRRHVQPVRALEERVEPATPVGHAEV
ncbi:hypothetical protein Pyn_41159 [Prunus yedoensis var. nudiflora]|uniref:Uncharacterized protein n=1 Tax=Prunus yedoensis var. nudiflora TaxID=2094558 RepID=A0A314Y2F7_PRUYE|nr:hypothetical protein Pyn_41159 [Prunus yedoensis var. nudiflora]